MAMLAVKCPHIEKPADGSACLESHPRVRVAQIIASHLAYGWSVPELCREYPYLAPAEVYSAMAYYFDHRQEIDEEIRRDVELTETLELIAKASDPDDWAGRVEFIPY
jgi:uncharacterized protein (DUF433 family)